MVCFIPFAIDDQPTRADDRFHLDRIATSVAVRGGVIHVLWVEQFWNFLRRKFDREIFEDGPSAKIGSLEKFRFLRYYKCKICNFHAT